MTIFSAERYFDYLESTRESIELYPDYADMNRPYLEALDNETSIDYYSLMQQYDQSRKEDYESYLQSSDAKSAESINTQENEERLRTEILEEGRIAYVYILDFLMSDYEAEKEVLLSFYDQIKDYDHLIFDLTDNGGGSMDYYINLMLLPNIDKTMKAEAYVFYRAGDNNLRFMTWLDKESFVPVSDMPELPSFDKTDLAYVDYFEKIDGFPYVIEPERDEKIFKGKIWMLVSEEVYSSAEFAAMFSKETGFATLVGTRTGGDGIGTSPVYITLPNSGLVVRHSPVYGTTSDGRNSEEFGTEPDIYSLPDESALDACLRAINESDG